MLLLIKKKFKNQKPNLFFEIEKLFELLGKLAEFFSLFK